MYFYFSNKNSPLTAKGLILNRDSNNTRQQKYKNFLINVNIYFLHLLSPVSNFTLLKHIHSEGE